MLLGCIADDFTGASDLANMLASGGMTTVQFVGIPAASAVPECDAAVIALKTRSIPAEQAVDRSLRALEWLRSQGCRQFFFKYCSTFDSTPAGNIGCVAEALLRALDTPHAVVCPAFPATGRTLFMGHLFVADRLLNESGMEHHPLNPMTDADIRRWLQGQTMLQVGFVPHVIVREGAAAIGRAIAGEAAAGRRLVVVDAVYDEDLVQIGRATASDRLITGGSGLALGLPENFRRAGLLSQAKAAFTPVKGPGAVLSGSCSTTAQAQVEEYRRDHPALRVAVKDLVEKNLSVDDAAAFVRAHAQEEPMVYSTAGPEQVTDAQSRYGREKASATIEHFFGALAARIVDEGVRRLAVGGGETSGAVVTALGLTHMLVGPQIDPGVPALAAEGPRSLRLALKSGNFGAVDFYRKALGMLGADR